MSNCSQSSEFIESFKRYQKQKNLMVFLERSGIKTITFCSWSGF